MDPQHLRLDVDVAFSHAAAVHEEDCPDIGPICQVRAEPPQLHDTSLWLTSIRLLGEYGLEPDLALQVVLPVQVVGTHTTYSDLSGTPITLDYPNIHHHNEDLVGPGDFQFYVHHSVKLGAGMLLGERLGISLPTGRVQPNPNVLGDLGLPHEHIQFGTGTVDPLLALDVTKSFRRWTMAGFAQAQIPLYQDRYGYQAGTRIVAGALASSSLGLGKPVFRAGATVVQEFAERWDGHVPTEDGNRGRTDVFVGPGVTLPFLDDWSASLDLHVRAWGRVVGAQLSMPVVLELSVGRLLHLESGYAEPERQAAGEDVEDSVTQGELAPLAPVAGKWTVFDFWAPWCEACKQLDRELRERSRARTDLAVRRVNIVDFDSPIARKELPGVSVLPHVRVVDPDGHLAFEASGAPADLLAELDARSRR